MKLNSLKYIFILIILLYSASSLQAQKIAVKTDVLLLAAMTPNLGGELVVSERTSVCLSAFTSNKPWGKDIKVTGVTPEVRYWFNGRPLIRQYVGIAALGAHYDITWDENIYKGDALGAGISFGHAWRLGRRIAIECYASCGAVYFIHKHYNINDNFEDYEQFKDAHSKVTGIKIIPTKIGVSFTYIIK